MYTHKVLLMFLLQDLDVICSNCSLTEWTLWSPCNMKCGPGQRERYRMNLNKTSMADGCDNRCYTQTINCTDNPPCTNNMRLGKTISMLIIHFLKSIRNKSMQFYMLRIRGHLIVW